MEEWGDLGQMVTAPPSLARKIETILLHWGLHESRRLLCPRLGWAKTPTGGGGTCSRDMGEAQFYPLRRLKIFRKFIVFVRWEGKERIPCGRRMSAQLASLFCFFSRSVFPPGETLLGWERPRWTWREATAGGRRPLSSEEGVDDAFILESPVSPPLEPPYPRVGGGVR